VTIKATEPISLFGQMFGMGLALGDNDQESDEEDLFGEDK